MEVLGGCDFYDLPMRLKREKENWSGKIQGESYADCIFERLIVRSADVRNTCFTNVHFKNSTLGIDTHYQNCTFAACKFFGMRGSMGTKTRYVNCKFINCTFIGMWMFAGQHYKSCTFSGLMRNPILNDANPKAEGYETIFEDGDLSEVLFENVSIYGKSVFRNSQLPTKGIKRYRNTNEILLNRAETIIDSIEDNSKIESMVLFDASLYKDHDPIVIDEFLLGSFFKTPHSREVFDRIVEGFELP